MKKKITLTLLALVCAFCCSFSLTACGGDDDESTKKYHTAAQWSAAFSDPSVADCYSLSEMVFPSGGEYGAQSRSLTYDKISEYYYFSLNDFNIDVDGTTTCFGDTMESAYKAGEYYYKRQSGDGVDSRYFEITSEEFAAIITDNSFADIAQSLLDYCKNGYDKFAGNGTSAWNDVHGRNYKAKNARVKIDETNSIVFEEIEVGITNGGAVYGIEATFFENQDKHIYQYFNDDPANEVSRPRPAPARLGGNTFKLVSIQVMNSEGVTNHDWDSWIAGVLASNSNKTITAKADGTIDGDIEIDMGNGATLALSTMKYTEDFVNAATYAKVSVSNAHIPELTEAQKVTLTGNISGGFTESVYAPDNETLYNHTFRLTQPKDDGWDFHFYFEVQQAAN